MIGVMDENTMNFCIGGPWNGSKLLGRVKFKKSFKVKDTSSKIVTIYIKKKVTFKNQSLVFWVGDELLERQANEMIKCYL
jgi:hypothetical protein